MQIVRFGPSGKMVCIGEDKNKSKWYVITSTVRPYLQKFKIGDEVSIRSELGKDGRTENLVYITANAEGATPSSSGSSDMPDEPQTLPPVAETKKPWSGNKSSYTPKSTYGKSPEEQESIKRQAIGHMTSRTMIALASHLTPENTSEMMEFIYNKYVELVG